MAKLTSELIDHGLDNWWHIPIDCYYRCHALSEARFVAKLTLLNKDIYNANQTN